MTKVYFVRHAQPEDGRADDRAGPLTEEGRADTALVLRTLRDKASTYFIAIPINGVSIPSARQWNITKWPFKRMNSCGSRRRASTGARALFQKRWADHNWHKDGGSSLFEHAYIITLAIK